MTKIIALALILFSWNAHSAENDYETTLSFVSSYGSWSENGKEGKLRFITKTVGSEHVFSKLYVQWITFFEDGVGPGEIFAEREILELNGRYLYFHTPTCLDKWECQKFHLLAEESFGKYRTVEFELVFPSVGKYEIHEKAL